MNTYYKYAPNVFLAKCTERHAKGDIINVTTKHGKENESEVFNLIAEKDGFFLLLDYSGRRNQHTDHSTEAKFISKSISSINSP